MGKTVSFYLDGDTLESLDMLVAAQADRDRMSGLAGRDVTSRSSLLVQIIREYVESHSVAELCVEDIRYAVVPLAEEYGLGKVSLFGSRARGDACADSDVDLLVEKGRARGLRVIAFEQAVAEKLGCPVDVVTTDGASKAFVQRAEQEAVVIYAAG